MPFKNLESILGEIKTGKEMGKRVDNFSRLTRERLGTRRLWNRNERH